MNDDGTYHVNTFGYMLMCLGAGVFSVALITIFAGLLRPQPPIHVIHSKEELDAFLRSIQIPKTKDTTDGQPTQGSE